MKPVPRLTVLAETGQWGVQGVASFSVSMVGGSWSPGRAWVSGAVEGLHLSVNSSAVRCWVREAWHRAP